MSNICCWPASMASSGSVMGLVLVGWSMRVLGFTGFCGFFFVEILGFRSGSVDFLDAVLCSILYEARVEKLHCLCSSSNTYFSHNPKDPT
jgi:hypothetical protein